MVVTSIVVGIEFFKKKSKQGDGFKVAWALGALYLILALGVDVAPEAAGPLALLVMMGVVFGSEFVLTDVLHVQTSEGTDTGEPAPPPDVTGGSLT